MLSKTIERLQHFVDKVCSIVTISMNRSFDEQISREHFVILVQSVNIDGVWGVHPYNPDSVSFFRMDHIISIHQEVELDPNDPNHVKMIEDFEKETGKKLESDIKKPNPLAILDKKPVVEETTTGDAMFVDIDSLERLAETTKKTFRAYDLLNDKS